MLWTLRNQNLESTHGCLAIKIFSLLKNKRNIFPRTNILAKVRDVQVTEKWAQCFIKQISLVVPPGKQTPGHFVWPACLPLDKPVWNEEQEQAGGRPSHPPHQLGRITRRKSQTPAARKPQEREAKQCPEPNVAARVTCSGCLMTSLSSLPSGLDQHETELQMWTRTWSSYLYEKELWTKVT